MITAIEIDFFKAQEQFESICEFVQRASEQGARIDQVERGLFPQAMEMCLHMLRAFVAAHGDGDERAELERDDGTLRRLDGPHDKRYLSIFGELIISRFAYGTREGQAIEWVPLDAALGLG
jgi:hypothetical protein